MEERKSLDGGVKKWEDGKLWENGKYLVFLLLCLVGGGRKVGGQKTLLFDWREKENDEKCNLYKFNIIT